MGKPTVVRTHSDLTLERAAEQLSELALGLTTGDIAVADGEQRVILHPGRAISLTFEGSEDTRSGRLTIELAWKTGLQIGGH